MARGVGQPERRLAREIPGTLVFSFRGRKLLAVPSQPRRLREVALSRYQPYTTKRQLYSSILKTAMKLRCEGVLAKAGPLPEEEALGLVSSRWLESLLENLRSRLALSWEHAVLAWPSQPSRKRLYLHLLTGDLAPVAFVKIGLNSPASRSMKSGLEALQQLGDLPIRRVRLPRALGYGQVASVEYTVLEPLPIEATPPRYHQDYDVSAILAEFSQAPRRMSGEEMTGLSWWGEYAGSTHRGHEVFHGAVLELLPLGAEVRRVHGDVGLSNMVLAGETLWLFDWENSHARGPALTDPVGYFLSFSVGKTGTQPASCLREFQRRYSSETAPQRRLDLMLALAYRFACGIPDAEFYMRHWPGLLPPAS